MIIDFHTHIFPDAIAPKTIPFLEKRSGVDAATDGTLEGLKASMRESGVDLSVILPVVTKPSQFASINAFAKAVNDASTGDVLSFGGIHPDCEDYREKLDYIKSLGLPGIKLHPDYQETFIDDERYQRIIRYADELDMIIVVHAGVDIGLPEPVHCTPERMRRVLDEIRPKRLVAAHMGGWRQWEQVYELLAGEEIYFDTAFTFDYIPQEMFLKIWEKHDKDKILFATDSPWGEQKHTILQTEELPLEKSEKEAIFSENAKKLLRLT